jgi:phage gp29-like protein
MTLSGYSAAKGLRVKKTIVEIIIPLLRSTVTSIQTRGELQVEEILNQLYPIVASLSRSGIGLTFK